MNFIHARKKLNKGDVVELTCEATCNFMLTDDGNFSSYKKGDIFGYYGGHFESFPARITAPHSGDWNIIIDTPNGEPVSSWDMKIIN
ncbi:MAG: DUF1883 domain-containing protein [Geobacteraceae bacterium]|nr:DUF1883 domain-containing protein [Geobacteraceae bacterium]